MRGARGQTKIIFGLAWGVIFLPGLFDLPSRSLALLGAMLLISTLWSALSPDDEQPFWAMFVTACGMLLLPHTGGLILSELPLAWFTYLMSVPIVLLVALTLATMPVREAPPKAHVNPKRPRD